MSSGSQPHQLNSRLNFQDKDVRKKQQLVWALEYDFEKCEHTNSRTWRQEDVNLKFFVIFGNSEPLKVVAEPKLQLNWKVNCNYDICYTHDTHDTGLLIM